MNETVKMYIETTNGEKLEQEVPKGLVEIYYEKGWKIVVEEKPKKTYFNTKKFNKKNNEE